MAQTKHPRHLSRVVPWFITVVLQACSQPLPKQAADPLLLGCWHDTKQTVQSADGATSEQAIDCTDEYFARQMTTQCLLKGGGDRYEYSYRILRDGVIQATVLSHSARASDVGVVTEVEYKVEGDQKRTTALPQSVKPHPMTSALRIETVGTRQVAPELCTPIGIRTFSPEKIIATVNGKPIVQADLDALIRDDTKSDTPERRVNLTELLIEEEVLVQEAIRRRIPERNKIPTDVASRPSLIQALLRDELDKNRPSDAQIQAKGAEELGKKQLKALTEELKRDAAIVRF